MNARERDFCIGWIKMCEEEIKKAQISEDKAHWEGFKEAMEKMLEF